jgi:hypothetical protein
MRFPLRLRGLRVRPATLQLTDHSSPRPRETGRGVGGRGGTVTLNKRPPTLSKAQCDVLGLESPSYENRQQASRVQQCPGVRHGCRHSSPSPPCVSLRGFAASREPRQPATRLTTLPPLAPVKRARGVGVRGPVTLKNDHPTRSKTHTRCARAGKPELQNRQQASRVRQCPGSNT